MGLFVVRYDYDLATTDQRDHTRPAHREWLDAQSALRLSGPTTDDGAVLIFEAADVEGVEALLDQDPFWLVGTVASRTISEWNPVLGPWKSTLGL